MYSYEDLERLLKCTYPSKVSSITQEKRTHNIASFRNLLGSAIAENALRYGAYEERLFLYSTQAGERICIQYPGKESVNNDQNKIRPFDFRPRIITTSGEVVRDLVFADMWSIVETINEQQHRMIKLLACLFFEMGRMVFHTLNEDSYDVDCLDENENTIGHTKRVLSWNRFDLKEEIMEALNLFNGKISIENSANRFVDISLEAFLYFFDLILQNEDIKYNYIKESLASGRIPTSDSMLMLASYLNGKTTLSVLLQRFVSSRGVANCKVDEIGEATDGMIEIINPKENLKNHLREKGYIFSEGSSISVYGRSISVPLKIPGSKIAVLSTNKTDVKELLESRKWRVYSWQDLENPMSFMELIALLEE